MEKDPDTEAWDKGVSVMQVVFWDGYIPEDLMWKTMFLIKKGGREYRGIGLVDTTWKVFKSILNSRLQIYIVLHDVLHGFLQRRGTGTAAMEVKMEQLLAGIFHKTLFQVFIDVRKAYDSLDIGRCMEILRGYVLVPKLQQILQWYWDGQRVVPKSGKYYGRPFSTGRGVTQVDLLSLTVFHIVVDAVVRADLQEVCGPQEAQRGFRWVTG